MKTAETATLSTYRKHRKTFLGRDNNAYKAQNHGIVYDTVGDWRGFEIDVAWAAHRLAENLRSEFNAKHGYENLDLDEQTRLDEVYDERYSSNAWDEFCKNTEKYIDAEVLDCMQFLANHPEIQTRWEGLDH